MTTHDDFELKRALDGLPRSIEPPEDLWPAIRPHLRRRVGRPGRPWWRAPRTLRIAAGLALIAPLAGLLQVERIRAGRWQVAAVTGAPTLGTAPIAGPRPLAVGEALATDAGSRALVDVGTIGHVEVGPATRVRLLEARATQHRLALERGTIAARIDAPPRLFIVETPSGTAVDLGCAYTLAVDSAGNSVIVVTAGWVSFEDRGRESLVPAGMRALSRRGAGVGTPIRDSAAAELVRAVTAFDFGGSPAALDSILALAGPRDAVTLWHLLGRTDGPDRERVYDRLAALTPPPAGVARRAALRLDRMALTLWWERLPGTLPIVPSWSRRVWLAWLRLVG